MTQEAIIVFQLSFIVSLSPTHTITAAFTPSAAFPSFLPCPKAPPPRTPICIPLFVFYFSLPKSLQYSFTLLHFLSLCIPLASSLTLERFLLVSFSLTCSCFVLVPLLFFFFYFAFTPNYSGTRPSLPCPLAVTSLWRYLRHRQTSFSSSPTVFLLSSFSWTN